MKFLLDVEDLAGTNCMRRLEQMAAMGAKASQSYKLKSTTGKFNINAKLYTKEQIDYIMDKNADLLYLFGYTNHPTIENKNAYFNFDKHTKENVDKYYGFRKINEASTKKVVADQGWKGPAYKVNTDEAFILMPDNMVDRVQEPARLWAEKQLGYTTQIVEKKAAL